MNLLKHLLYMGINKILKHTMSNKTIYNDYKQNLKMYNVCNYIKMQFILLPEIYFDINSN